MHKLKIASSVLFICSLYSCSKIINPSLNQLPKASDGIINLRNVNFTKIGLIELNGIWKFQQNGNDLYYASSECDDRSWHNIKVPGYWNDVLKKGEGVGWYRLRVRVDDSFWQMQPAVYIKGINTAYELYVNGIQIMGAGIVGQNRDESKPSLLPHYSSLPYLKKNEIIIAVKVANFFHRGGGLNKPIIIGSLSEVQQSLWKEDFISALVLGFILMMGMYHVILWLKRKEDYASLWFSIFCFVIFFHTLAIDNYFERIFPNYNIFELRFKVEYGSLALSWTTFSVFLYFLFPKEMGKKYVITLGVCGIVLLILPLCADVRFYSKFVMAYNIMLIVGGLWSIIGIIIAIFRKREDAFVVLLGFFVLMLTVINDILHNHHVIQTFFMSQFGLGGFLFFQSVILSVRFARAYRTAEYLSQSLNVEVQKKTEELRLKTEAALKAKEEVERSLKKIETLNARMAKELELAKRVHDRIIPKEIISREYLSIYIESRPYMVVGGDYYDVTDIEKNKTRIFLADAMGHGVSASLMTLLIKSEYDKIKYSLGNPAEVFLRLNEYFVENYKALRTFFTGIIIDVDVMNKHFVFSSAGHHDQFFISNNNIIPLYRTGRAIGISKESLYHANELQYRSGDRLFLFTDGVFEEFNLNKEEFGIDRLEQFIREHLKSEAKTFCNKLMAAVDGHVYEEQLNDDLTFIVIELL